MKDCCLEVWNTCYLGGKGNIMRCTCGRIWQYIGDAKYKELDEEGREMKKIKKKLFDLATPEEFDSAVEKAVSEYGKYEQIVFLQGIAFTLKFLRENKKEKLK